MKETDFIIELPGILAALCYMMAGAVIATSICLYAFRDCKPKGINILEKRRKK